ncbi:PREDICTED: pentatricopeptide repeat-containing protein At3g60980, mitochondrial-like [Camelina sativa]|uniref:Pentatricopeptide repeat-containing protein At3g60980, mitochondrial-like n=1 Tax=Camelina sativa TaxID=90675 RepID=A0ABM0XM94_CAMSA|nr:PREDICTED: pentatricopeptide repeat-containing protein At3g60980, mitochondrial-like [Camelina sativa]
MANSDCRAVPLHERVAFLIRMSDLDTAAKHARLAPFAEHEFQRCFATTSADYVDWVCGSIIVAMCKAERYRDALDLIQYFFNEQKMIPLEGSFNHVIKRVLDGSSNARTILLGVKRLAQAGSFDEAMDPFPMRCGLRSLERLPFGVRLDVSNSLIRELLDLGRFKEALKLFGEINMREDHNRAAVASATFMEYWFKQGKEEAAMDCYNNLLALELNRGPRIFFYPGPPMELTEIGSTGAIALLEVLLKYDKKTQAWALFHRLLDIQTPYFDTDTLNPTMVNECFKMGWFNAAIQTFKILRRPEATDFRNIITRFCELGLFYEAEHFFAEMQQTQLSVDPDVSTFTVLMDAYVKAGRFDDVLRISNHMVDASLNQIAKLSCLSVWGQY